VDIISHGLYGWALFGTKNKKQFRLATGFGVLPDLLAFGLPSAIAIIALISGNITTLGAPWHTQPAYVYAIYNVTHSLITWAVVFWVLRLIYKKPVKASFARLLHILIDIPTHSLAFFATPFLWPISSYRFNGIHRNSLIIFIPNIIILAIIYTIYFRKKRRHHRKAITSL